MRWLLAAVFGCALLLAPGEVHALSLRWSAPSECLTREQLAARIAALLARHELPEPAIEVQGDIARSDAGEYALTLIVRSQAGQSTRNLRDRSCEALSEAAAWLVVLAGDQAGSEPSPGASGAGGTGTSARNASTSSGRADRRQAATPEEHTVEANERVVDPKADREAPAEDEPRASANEARPDQTRGRALDRLGPRWLRAGLFAGVWQAALPAPQPLLGGRLGLARGPLYGELRGQATVARSSSLAGDGDVSIASHGLSVAGCGQWGERLRIGPCLRIVGLLSIGTVSDITAPKTARVLWLTSELSLLAGLKLAGPFELLLDAGVGVPLSARPRFYVAGKPDVTRASVLSAYGSIGVGVRWP